MRGQVKRKDTSTGYVGFNLWWLRHCFSAFKVSATNGLFLGQMIWVKLVFLEARLRPVEQLDREVEIGC
jgi:hypothetical protein